MLWPFGELFQGPVHIYHLVLMILGRSCQPLDLSCIRLATPEHFDHLVLQYFGHLQITSVNEHLYHRVISGVRLLGEVQYSCSTIIIDRVDHGSLFIIREPC